MAEIKDSGNRREFDSGAVRDIAEGKGRCDLLPLSVVSDILDDVIIKDIYDFIETKDKTYLHEAILIFTSVCDFEDPYTTMLEVAIHYEDGCKNMAKETGKKESRFIVLLIVL